MLGWSCLKVLSRYGSREAAVTYTDMIELWAVSFLAVVVVHSTICLNCEKFIYRSYMQRGWRFVDENEKTLKIKTEQRPPEKTAQALERLAR